MTALEEIKKALAAAEQFIVNGAELGYIRMPDPETPDSAHDTLPMIRQAQTALESLQRENDEKSAWIKAATTEITKAIGGGSEMFTPHGDDFRVDPVFVATFIQFRRERHAESKKASIQKERELLARAEAVEAEVKRYRVALIAAKTRMRNCRGAIESDQVVDKDVHGSLQNGIRDIQDALASTGGEHYGN